MSSVPSEQSNNSNRELTSAGIVVSELKKTYKGGKVKALNGLSLSINPGESFGIVGPNGAGKTTLFGCLLAFLRVDSGTITIDGMPPDAMHSRRIIGYLPERLTFDKWMTGRQFMHFHYELAEQPIQDKQRICDELLSTVGLETSAFSMAIKKYSRGMLQRLGFAQALIGTPKYLLLDEPASGVDPGGVLLLRKLLKELKAKGMTIVLNSHQLDQVEKLCDRVAFIKSGHVEAIENLQSDQADLHRFAVRWKGGEQTLQKSDLQTILDALSATDLQYDADQASFNVADVDSIAAIIKAMVLKGYPIIQAGPQDNRLERYFAADDQQKGTTN